MEVLGFFEESFTGEEQAEPYQIGVGYTKVRSGSARQLTFNVRGINGTASKLHTTLLAKRGSMGCVPYSLDCKSRQRWLGGGVHAGQRGTW